MNVANRSPTCASSDGLWRQSSCVQSSAFLCMYVYVYVWVTECMYVCVWEMNEKNHSLFP